MASPSPKSTTLDGRMRDLHRATLDLYTDLSLDSVLNRIVEVAKSLVEAKYAALGVPDGQGGLRTFLSKGMSEDQAAQIPNLPIGKGLIGEMLREIQGIRIPDIAEDSRSAGFPEGHPAMTSFLGVPITAYGRPLGQIYLTDKEDGAEFTEDDQRLIEMLAAHAAAAIENARLYRQVLSSEEELTQRNEELELIHSLTTAASTTLELDELLEAMLDRAIRLFSAQAGEAFIYDPIEAVYRLAVHRGEAPEAFFSVDKFGLGQGFIGLVAESGKPIWSSSLGEDPRFKRQPVLEAGFDSFVSVPMTSGGAIVGVISLAFHGQREISERDVGLLEAVGAGIGIAVENARLSTQARRIAILEERERIGMDLHDGIIQSIYAVGLTLDSTKMMVADDSEGAKTKLAKVANQLNTIMSDIRAYILDLKPSRVQPGYFAESLEDLLRGVRADSLLEGELTLDPELANQLRQDTSNTLFLIAQEAVSNTAKHSKAKRLWISVREVNEDIVFQVLDNGVGFGPDGVARRLGHGLNNMQERAQQIGGSFDIVSGNGEGTSITIRIPTVLALNSTAESHS
jgi:signal transduction histidine kinase